MAEEGKFPPPSAPSTATADAQLFGLLTNLLQQGLTTGLLEAFSQLEASHFLPKLISPLGWKVESLSNQEEVELRAKIQALGMEITKVPSKSAHLLDEMEIAEELDKLSSKLDHVDEMVSSAMAADPQVQSLLSSTADLWMPVITASSDERRNFTAPVSDGNQEANGKDSK
nr:COPII coat assembly protein like [Ipomoea batatas]